MSRLHNGSGELLKARSMLIRITIGSTVANNVANTHVIEQVTRIGNREVRQILEELLAFSLVEKKGVFIFSTFKVNDSGLVALGALRHIFGKDADVRYFDLALREFLTAQSTLSQEAKSSG